LRRKCRLIAFLKPPEVGIFAHLSHFWDKSTFFDRFSCILTCFRSFWRPYLPPAAGCGLVWGSGAMGRRPCGCVGGQGGRRLRRVASVAPCWLSDGSGF